LAHLNQPQGCRAAEALEALLGGYQLNRLQFADLVETQKNAEKFTEWIIGSYGVLSVNGKKLVQDLVRLAKKNRNEQEQTRISKKKD